MNPSPVSHALLQWYDTSHRTLPWRNTSDPWAIWVSEVMLQQTQVATVISYFNRFMQRFPAPSDLAEADIQEALKLWEGLGYYSRARNLHKAAGTVALRHKGKVPDDLAAFRALSGVGDYIAAAVLSIAFGQRLAVVDGNVKRVLARLFELDMPVNRAGSHKFFQTYADPILSPDRPGDFNQAIMELGAMVCRPKSPVCECCPLRKNCLSCRHQTTAVFPVREAKKKVPHRHLVIAVILKGKTLLAVQRPLDGFLGGLWECPGFSAADKEISSAEIEAGLKQETGLTVQVDRKLSQVHHAYTHFTLSADVYLCRYETGRVRLREAVAHQWVTFSGLERLPVHRAQQKFFPVLAKAMGRE